MIQVSDTLFRGPRPMTYEAFKALDVDQVINLETGWFEVLNHRNEEEEMWASNCGQKLIHIPCSDFHAPTKKQVQDFLTLVEQPKRKTYVHCLHGEDRTGYMCAAYRIIVQDWDPQKAIDEMYSLGFHKFPYFFWVETLRRL